MKSIDEVLKNVYDQVCPQKGKIDQAAFEKQIEIDIRDNKIFLLANACIHQDEELLKMTIKRRASLEGIVSQNSHKTLYNSISLDNIKWLDTTLAKNHWNMIDLAHYGADGTNVFAGFRKNYDVEYIEKMDYLLSIGHSSPHQKMSFLEFFSCSDAVDQIVELGLKNKFFRMEEFCKPDMIGWSPVDRLVNRYASKQIKDIVYQEPTLPYFQHFGSFTKLLRGYVSQSKGGFAKDDWELIQILILKNESPYLEKELEIILNAHQYQDVINDVDFKGSKNWDNMSYLSNALSLQTKKMIESNLENRKMIKIIKDDFAQKPLKKGKNSQAQIL